MLTEEYHHLLTPTARGIVSRKGESLLRRARHKIEQILSVSEEQTIAISLAQLGQLAAGLEKFSRKAAIDPGKSKDLTPEEREEAEKFLEKLSRKMERTLWEAEPLERGRSYYFLNLLEKIPLGEGVAANLFVFWLYIPPLIGEPFGEHAPIPVPAFFVQVSPQEAEAKSSWLKINWLIDEEKRSPFLVPPKGKRPEEWSDEELTLGYLLYLYWVSHFYIFLGVRPGSSLLGFAIHLPGVEEIGPLNIHKSRSSRKKLRKNFPLPSFNVLFLDCKIRTDDILAQLCLIALRQNAAGKDVHGYLADYAKKYIKGKEAEIYAAEAVSKACENWLYPVSRSSLKQYLKEAGKGIRFGEKYKDGKKTEFTDRTHLSLRQQKGSNAQHFNPYEVAEMIEVNPKTIYRWIGRERARPKYWSPLLFDLQEVKRLEKREEEKTLRRRVVGLIAKKLGISYSDASKRVNRRLKSGLSPEEAAKKLLESLK